MHGELRNLPSVARLLDEPAVAALASRFRRERVVEVLRAVLEDARGHVRGGAPIPEPSVLVARAGERLRCESAPAYPRVVNATGVCLHTNLGRALLADTAVDALVDAARHPSALELNLTTGRRGHRGVALSDDLRALTGADAALVVNNNAAAVLLALAAIAAGREVVVSRGELVEIGGSFRMPDVMMASGARLREVGTTNRTHADDYRRAIGSDTGALLKVHPSNFEVRGFTASVPIDVLSTIARDAGVPLVDDLGSGALVDLTHWGLPAEPVVRDRIAAGADLVTFSGDKLLGGPQAGIVVGRRDLVERLASHPLSRAVRPCKLTLAALSATLRLHRDAPDLAAVLPTLRWLTRSLDELERVGAVAASQLAARLGAGYRVRVVASEARIGSGAVPARTIPSRALEIRHPGQDAGSLAARFRTATPPIIGRVQGDRLLLDLRGAWRPEDLVPEQL